MTGQAANKKQRYAPIPLRALCDPRLGWLHLRTLGIVAAFDRLGKNGQGCWTSQNKIAEILGVGKTRLSHSLSDLRDWGYITSAVNPQKRWFRVHRVIYTEADFDTLGTGKSVAPQRNCSEKSVAESDPIGCPGAQHQLRPPIEKDNETNNLQNVTIVPTITRTIEDAGKGLAKGQNCAEARSRSLPLAEAETYLTECEELAASPDRDTLKFEREAIQRIAEDACLPEQVNERAVKLLAQIPT